MRLTGLPGVRGARRGVNAFTIKGAMHLLYDDNETVVVSGNDGSLTLWKDDQGKYRSDHSCERRMISSHVHTSRRAMRQWLSATIPQIDFGPYRAMWLREQRQIKQEERKRAKSKAGKTETRRKRS